MSSDPGREIEESELHKYNAVVQRVERGSIASRAGIKAKDRIISINSHILSDLIDYNFCVGDANVKVLLERGRGELIEFDIEKDYDEDLGVAFESPVFDSITRCANSCMFCFMDQMPDGLRKSLYLKDEDYRLSFLYGNFITMTRMNEEDFERIKSLYLSPLYISVHTTNTRLRKQILKSHKAENIIKQLEELTSSGIAIHTQVVLMPEVNDGDELIKTIEDLSYFYPQLESIGIVPVGLTQYREGLAPLREFTEKEARAVIAMIKPYQKKFRRRFDKNLIYLADEFYYKAGEPLPEGFEYDDYPQYENGIGIARYFYDEYHANLSKIPSRIKYPKKFSMVTGKLGTMALANIVHDLNSRVAGLEIKLETVENKFFGGGVTVTGLLTGRDVIDHFMKKPKEIPETIIVPSVMLNEEIFLDDITVDSLKSELSTSVEVVESNFKSLLDYILK
ncbi:MAG: hypothetical protein A2008_13175 [Candidatus Wallbacteria bacterium GWC2_49_35]|uniref:PDZ domain-containing protein n=1 Tax=Candidatus Wallbacteria bacterium GWC2_49_35 TaxID=1817813 RepID=A0A1F7WKN2_9BACT|nr:MAG: hypothetical protein A2008_13175 [Candidatus Wallbacteria bacterium GWC2_49_35]HBC74380.1 DUF512 domain-containing protein [Candidatus Wallbacteria bacterium]